LFKAYNFNTCGRHLDILAQCNARGDKRLETLHGPVCPSYFEHTRLAPDDLHARPTGEDTFRDILGHLICKNPKDLDQLRARVRYMSIKENVDARKKAMTPITTAF